MNSPRWTSNATSWLWNKACHAAAAKERAIADGVSSPETRQRHGDLLESLRELGNDIRLLVIGRQGESSDGAELHVGSQLESVIRIMRRPLLVTPTRFKQPESAMLAFDGGATTRKGVEMLAASPLLKGTAYPSGDGRNRDDGELGADGGGLFNTGLGRAQGTYGHPNWGG